MNDPFMNPKHVQGSPEWLAERQKHIGASDAAIILGTSPWKTPYKLWEQKLGIAPPDKENDAMKRGSEMEPLARHAFEEETGLEVFPQCIYSKAFPFMMASMDGLTLDKDKAVEIKCPGKKAHDLAKEGKVPEYYMPQLQHQMFCLELDSIYYYSFDGEEGVLIEVPRDEEFIENLIEKEKEFWECVQSQTPPPMTSRDYDDRDGPTWTVIGARLREIDHAMKELKAEQERLKKEVVSDANGRSCRGGGITLTRSFPKGRVDYTIIPELEGIDLDQYRKPSKEQWTLRIN